ncbi:adenylyl-sulfate kinase [Fusibacter bizertensis]|uniref:Adenylyl-sulfate kinase n=1 Tax=Fusibacter bizertensis TaxID=1488331 RepID=A0ABT6NDU7_9FIRM|nr:adenylyl-sulfate kinase [Fusibacter bizertensis]MDH8678590.1 adenylyl-sulfate kinase [Fusibacter bizertensis]
MEPGKVLWITGLSGAGKSSVAKLLYDKIRRTKSNVVLFDGDELRIIFGNDLGYTEQDRRISAMRNSRLCSFLSKQGIDVVCATISMYDDCRNWNRENIDNYLEIYLKVPINVLIERDQKGLYTSAIDNIESNVLGINQKFEEPQNSDLVIVNDGQQSIENIVENIMNELNI